MIDGTELEILKVVLGLSYRRRRDQLLASKVDFVEMAMQSKHQPDRRVEIIANIIAGWSAHRADYDSLLRSMNAIDVQHESMTVTGVAGATSRILGAAQRTLGENTLPLYWEQVLKFQAVNPAWQTSGFLNAIAMMPSELSIEPLLWALEETSDPGMIDGIHQTLIRQPYKSHKDRLLQLKQQFQWRGLVMEDLLTRIKLEAKKAPAPKE
jgi:hypothetical protein